MATCPVPGCGVELPSEVALCGPHWRRVPMPLRDAVYATWRGRLKALRTAGYAQAAAAHEAAKRDAVAALGGDTRRVGAWPRP